MTSLDLDFELDLMRLLFGPSVLFAAHNNTGAFYLYPRFTLFVIIGIRVAGFPQPLASVASTVGFIL